MHNLSAGQAAAPCASSGVRDTPESARSVAIQASAKEQKKLSQSEPQAVAAAGPSSLPNAPMTADLQPTMAPVEGDSISYPACDASDTTPSEPIGEALRASVPFGISAPQDTRLIGTTGGLAFDDQHASGGLPSAQAFHPILDHPVVSDRQANAQTPADQLAMNVAAESSPSNDSSAVAKLQAELSPPSKSVTSMPASILTTAEAGQLLSINDAPFLASREQDDDTVPSSAITKPPAGDARSMTVAVAPDKVGRAAAFTKQTSPPVEARDSKNVDLVYSGRQGPVKSASFENSRREQTVLTSSTNSRPHDQFDGETRVANAASPEVGGSLSHRLGTTELAGTTIHSSPIPEPGSKSHIVGQRESVPDTDSSSGLADMPSPSDAGAIGSQVLEGSIAGTTVNTARLIERLKESEINLNVRSMDWGNVAIHTAISRDRLSAQISLERIDLGKLIAGEIPALQAKLGQEHGIQATIEVHQQNSSFAGDSSQSQNQPNRPRATSRPELPNNPADSMVILPAVISDGRLDIRV